MTSSILGNRVLRKEDPALLTTGGRYVDDHTHPDAAWVTFLRSPFAHADIVSIDASDVGDGVIAVFTSDDIDLPPEIAGGPTVQRSHDQIVAIGETNPIDSRMARPLLADGRVRFVGDIVAAVVTTSRAEGVDAAERVVVDYEALPVIVDVEEAATDQYLLHPTAGTNLAVAFTSDHDERLFDGCDVHVNQRIVNQRIAACPMETRAVLATWDDARLCVTASTQTPIPMRNALADKLGLAPEAVRVIAPDVGGGFGAKIGLFPEELLVAWIATRLRRAVRWTESRSESMLGLGHGRGQVQYVEIGGRRDGTIEAYRLRVLQETGAYPVVGSLMPFMTHVVAPGCYDIPHLEFSAASYVTNTPQTVAYRGAGRPEGIAAIERAIDLFAAEVNLDPADVRRKNFIHADDFPFTTAVGVRYDSGNYHGALERALDAADYRSLRDEQQRRRVARDPLALGIGLAAYVEITNPIPGTEYGAVEILPDGTAEIRTGTSPQGQGHATAWAMLVSEQLGIPLADITLLAADTDIVRTGAGTMGSRSLQSSGVAVRQAATEVLERGRQLAANLLEAHTDDIVLNPDTGRLQVVGTPARSFSWGEVADAARNDGHALIAHVDYETPGPTWPFGVHVAVVDVDIETGQVTIRRMVAVDDAGTILNPVLAEGQVHGGLAQGVAQALMEEFRFDDDGNPLTTNFADYGIISAAELPTFELHSMETPAPDNVLGAKGIGESGTIGAGPAVQNAVIDALSHLGVRHIDMPLTPERVWNAIAQHVAGERSVTNA